jgi:hypothetical protein
LPSCAFDASYFAQRREGRQGRRKDSRNLDAFFAFFLGVLCGFARNRNQQGGSPLERFAALGLEFIAEFLIQG